MQILQRWRIKNLADLYEEHVRYGVQDESDTG